MNIRLPSLSKSLELTFSIVGVILITISQASPVYAQSATQGCVPSTETECSQLPQVDQEAINNGWYQYVDNGQNCSASGSTSGTTTISSGSKVYMLGDSITERAQSAYQTAWQARGITATIDAEASRSLSEPGIDGNQTTGMQAISQDIAPISAANAIIIALGTNGGDTDQSIDAAIQAIRAENSTASIYWVDTIGVNGSNFTQAANQAANLAIYSEAGKDKYQVLSWFKVVDPNGSPTSPSNPEVDPHGYIDNSDHLGVHPTPAGIAALVNLVVGTLTGTPGSSGSGSSGSSCCSGGGGTTLNGSTNGIQAYNFFIQEGLSPAAAAGIIGNMTEESTGVDPERLENDYTGEQPAESPEVQAVINNTKMGWGIVQWTPPSSIITTSQKQGTPLQSIDTLSYQLTFLWNELNTSYPTVIGQLKSATSPTDAATIFLSGFEKGNPSPYRQVYAQAYYNLAVNGTPLPPNVPVSTNQGGTSDSGSSSTGSSCGSGTSSAGYENPYRDVKGLTAMRIDEGVDYGGTGPVYALGAGTVVVADNGNADWPGGNYVAYQLSGGADAGQYVYIAENCAPAVKVGQPVTTSTVVCNMQNAFPYTESGWSYSAKYNDTPMAHCVYITVPDGTATAFGYNFNQLLTSLSPAPPSGTWQFPNQAGGKNLAGSLPNGWPNSSAAQAAPNQLSC